MAQQTGSFCVLVTLAISEEKSDAVATNVWRGLPVWESLEI